MAFCVRSKRKMEFQENKTSIPGPGHYIKLTPTKIKNNSKFFPPFHSSAEREPLIKINDIPGPGSYNLDSNNSNSNLEITNQHLKTNKDEKEDNNIIQDFIITNYNTNAKNSNNSLLTNVIGLNSSITNSSNHNNISLKKGINKMKNYSSKDINQNSKLTENNLTNILNNLDGNIFNPYYGNEKLGFLSQTSRFNKKKDIDNSNTPGPGSYYESINNSTLTESKFKLTIERKNIKNNSIVAKTGSLNRIVSIPSKIMNGYIFENNNKYNSEKNIFYNSNNSIESPTYSKKNKIFNYTFQGNSNSNILINKIIYNRNSNSNKELNLLIDKTSLKLDNKYCGTNELVGPGTYDPSLLEKNNNAINWSKGFNIKKLNLKNDIKKRLKLIEEMKKNGNMNNYNRNLNKKTFKKIAQISSPCLSSEQIKQLKPNILNNKIIDSFRNSFIPNKSDIPGPGYYSIVLNNPENDKFKNEENKTIFNDKIKSKIPNMNYRKFQCDNNKITHKFGSNCERPVNKIKSVENIGPTTYFRQKNKYEPEKKNTIYKQLILGKTLMSHTVHNNFDFYFPNGIIDKDENNKSNSYNNIVNQNKAKTNRNTKKIQYTNNFNTNIESQNYSMENTPKTYDNRKDIPFSQTIRSKSFYSNPGPGSYELNHTFIKPSFSSKQIMDNKEERFSVNYNGNIDNPGPGTYTYFKNLEFGGKIIPKNIETKNKNNRRDLYKENKIKKIIELNKKRNEVPGAGTYNDDKRNSIIYKIYSKINPKQSYQSPFLNSSQRFLKSNKDNEIISPTLYEPYKYEKALKNNQYMAFNKAIRFNKECDENKQNAWFLAGPGSYDIAPEWNKKSYNALFSGN